MKPLDIRMWEKPALHRPLLLCGLPDSGLVAKIAIDQVIRELSPKLFAEVYSYWFPPQVVVEASGFTRLLRNELYYWKHPGEGRDLIIYTGDTQPIDPSGAYTLAEEVLEVARGLGADEVVILAAYIRGKPVSEPHVYGAATDVDTARLYKDHGIEMADEGAITWMHGLLLGVAALKGMKGVCLSGETPGGDSDPKAAHALLKAANNLLQLPITLKELEEQARGMVTPAQGSEEDQERGRLGYIK